MDDGERPLPLSQEGDTYIRLVVNSLPATTKQLEEYRKEQETDPNCSQVMKYCCGDWPKKKEVLLGIRPYWDNINSLTIHNGLLLYNQRIVTTDTKVGKNAECRQTLVSGGRQCQRTLLRKLRVVQNVPKRRFRKREPLIVSPLPHYPWQVVGTDLFELKREQYLIVVDYFSRYPEVAKLTLVSSHIPVLPSISQFPAARIP